jgi:hypothetical protein
MYVVDRDFGFAPNPFHNYCSLATCKPLIRKRAEVKDWIIGMGGARLKATGRCIFAMQVTDKLTFDDYWSNPLYFDKRPVRNGSQKMMVGDNIYHRNSITNEWYQADSHHSNSDGTVNLQNLITDTKPDNVLLSQHFYYFGKEAPIIPNEKLEEIGYSNQRGYRVFEDRVGEGIIKWLQNSFSESLNQILGDPFDFDISEKRYSGLGSKIT